MGVQQKIQLHQDPNLGWAPSSSPRTRFLGAQPLPAPIRLLLRFFAHARKEPAPATWRRGTRIATPRQWTHDCVDLAFPTASPAGLSPLSPLRQRGLLRRPGHALPFSSESTAHPLPSLLWPCALLRGPLLHRALVSLCAVAYV